MNTTDRFKRWSSKLGKYKYAGLILLLGIGLMCLPVVPSAEPEQEQPEQIRESLPEKQLEEILSLVEGAGKVRVLLSLETGIAHEYQQDLQSDTTEDSVQMQTQTVLYQEGSDEYPVLVTTTYPTYRGAVVVCEGADKASVQLAVIRAVSSLTGLGSDHIAVIKMNTK